MGNFGDGEIWYEVRFKLITLGTAYVLQKLLCELSKASVLNLIMHTTFLRRERELHGKSTLPTCWPSAFQRLPVAKPRLYAIALRRTRCTADAEGVDQETLLNACTAAILSTCKTAQSVSAGAQLAYALALNSLSA